MCVCVFLLFCMVVPPSRTFNFITRQTREILMRAELSGYLEWSAARRGDKYIRRAALSAIVT
jgi:hypothetical protein